MLACAAYDLQGSVKWNELLIYYNLLMILLVRCVVHLWTWCSNSKLKQILVVYSCHDNYGGLF